MKTRAIIWSKQIGVILVSFFIVIFFSRLSVAEDVAGVQSDYDVPVPTSQLSTGAVKFAYPIQLPPARGGLTPDLSLHYNSYLKNGWLGMGWSLDPGAIRRSTKRGVNYSVSDYVYARHNITEELVSRSDWGANYFGTKVERNFVKYYKDPSTGGWEVLHKDGTKYFYGTDSFSRQTNSKGIFKWCLDRVQDANGNEMTISYYKDNGQIYMDQIDYPGNNSVIFYKDTQERSDKSAQYGTGSAVVTAERLKTIEILSSGQLASKYVLDYETDTNTLRTRLTSITRYGSDDTTTLPATHFSYKNGGDGSFDAVTFSSGNGNAHPITGDFNGDSITDLAYIPWFNNIIYLWEANGDGTYDVKTLSYGPYATSNDKRWGSGDFNGDGRSDFLEVETTGSHPLDGYWEYGYDIYIRIFNEDETFTTYHYYQPHQNRVPGLFLVADFNGDGKSDFAQTYLAQCNDLPPGMGQEEFYYYRCYWIFLWLSNGDGTFNKVSTQGPFDLYNAEPICDSGCNSISYTSSGSWMSADINGDGRADLVNLNYNKSATVVWQAQPDGTFIHGTICRSTSPCYLQDKGQWHTGDLNGDGLADIIHIIGWSPHIDTWISKGGGYAFSRFTFEQHPYDLWRVLDVNGDGMEDLFRLQYDQNSYNTLISKGDGTFDVKSQVYNGPPVSPGSWKGGDFNGDGIEDLAIMSAYTDSATTLISNVDGRPGLLEKIEIEKGAVVDLEYLPSSAYQNELLPFVVPTLSKMTINDGVADTDAVSVTEYDYHGGLYDYKDREFRGFEWARQLNPDGTVIKTWYHQDRFRKKYEYRIELRENSQEDGTLLYETTLDWQPVSEENDWGFVKLNSRQTDYYDGATVFTRRDYLYDDANGNLMQSTLSGTDAEDIIKSFEYDNYGDWNWRTTLEKVKSPSEPNTTREVLYRYYPNGNLDEKEEVNHTGENPVWKYEYDTYGNVTDKYDADGNPPTHYEYDTAANTYPVSITNPKGHVTLKEWDYRYGKEAWTQDPNGHRTHYDYDPFGRLIQTDFPDGGRTQKIFYDYCDEGDCENSIFPLYVVNKVKETGSSTVDSHLYYDGLGRKVQTTATGEGAKFIASKTHYDEMGRTYYESGPFERLSSEFLDWNWNNYPISQYPYTHTFYDKRGRPTSQESMDGENGTLVTTYQYNGFAVTSTDPDESSKTEVKDHTGRIIHMIEHADNGDIHTRYAYNSSDDLLRVKNHFWTDTEPDQNCIIMTYNTLGRKTSMNDPDLGQWQYQYDANGNLTLQTDAKGQVITFAYDELNRATSKTYSTSDPAVTYTYDNPGSGANGIGRPHTVSNQVTTTTYDAYDEMGRELCATKSIQGAPASEYTFVTTYDLAGKVASTTYPDYYRVDYAYHPGSNLLYTVTDSAGSELAVLTGYAPIGKIGHILYGNDVTTDYTYDGWSNRLTSIVTNGPGGSPVLQDRSYGYTPAGDIELITDSVKWVSYYYDYDKLHRLTSETTSDGSIGLTPSILELNYDNPDHIHAVSSAAHRESNYDYSYDASGNMQNGPDFTHPDAIAARTLAFNADNMPEQVAHTSSGTVNFLYDGEGKRAKKDGPAGTTYYFSNEFEIISGFETRYIFAGNLRIAKVTGTNTTYFHKDHLGSSTVMTDTLGTALETGGYLPYGIQRENPGITLTNYKFTDQELDTESGLYNYDARLYDPVIARFISPDSIVPDLYDPQSLNRYAYCRNNPLNAIDPEGETTRVIVTNYKSAQLTTGDGQKIQAYKTRVYRDGKLTGTFNFTRDSYGKSEKGPAPYGKNREAPPGTFNLRKHPGENNKVDIYDEIKENVPTVHGPQGNRTWLEFHQIGTKAKGCLTTDKQQEFYDKLLPDFNNENEEVTGTITDRNNKLKGLSQEIKFNLGLVKDSIGAIFKGDKDNEENDDK